MSSQWHKITEHINLLPWQNQLCVVEVAGKKITLAYYQEKIYASAHKCPHASGIMAQGFIDALGNIVCPLHRYKFSLQTGRNTSGEGFYLKTYPTELRTDGWYVQINSSSLWGW
ncbi:MAG: (2Fe-2S)-binding protein [Bacteroidetes bacterium]|nr:MAG: (2Fe-2S)-binding protein [Bacteroidota bacterium]TAE71485.1 MAG: (2Fe-2S)-binding protein [Bacteroidota bacterium]